MVMKKIAFLALLAIISTTFALSLKLDHVESDFGHGCQYYLVLNEKGTNELANKPSQSILFEKNTRDTGGEIWGQDWEILRNVEKTRSVWESKITCEMKLVECDTKNISDPECRMDGTKEIESCEDTGSFKDETYYVDEWVALKSSESFQAGESKIRFCMNYNMPKQLGEWAFRADIIPAFAGKSYPEYAWFNASWQYRQNCTWNAENISSNLTSFVVPCIIDTATLIGESKMNADCSDLRAVSDDETTSLDYEIENGTCDTASTVVWIGVDVAAGEEGHAFIYYGNDEATDAQDAIALWDAADYVSVWHGGSDYLDSMAVNNLSCSGTAISTNSTRCKYGNCIEYDANGDTCTKSGATHPTGTTPRTFTGWVYRTNDIQNYLHIFDLGSQTTHNADGFYPQTNIIRYAKYGATADMLIYLGGATTLNNVKSLIGYRVNNASSVTGIFNETLNTNSTLSENTSITSGIINIGGTLDGWGKNGAATIDEARLRAVASSDDWLKAEYELSATAAGEETPESCETCAFFEEGVYWVSESQVESPLNPLIMVALAVGGLMLVAYPTLKIMEG